MLRRPLTVLSITAEDIADYEDCRERRAAEEEEAEAAAAMRGRRHHQNLMKAVEGHQTDDSVRSRARLTMQQQHRQQQQQRQQLARSPGINIHSNRPVFPGGGSRPAVRTGRVTGYSSSSEEERGDDDADEDNEDLLQRGGAARRLRYSSEEEGGMDVDMDSAPRQPQTRATRIAAANAAAARAHAAGTSSRTRSVGDGVFVSRGSRAGSAPVFSHHVRAMTRFGGQQRAGGPIPAPGNGAPQVPGGEGRQ